MKPVIQLLTTAGILLLLVACAGQQTIDFDATRNESRLQKINHWQLRGRAVLQAEGRTDSVGLHWQQAADKSELTLSGPAGWGRYSIAASFDYQVIDLGEDFDKLPAPQQQQIEHQLNNLPLAQLSYWMKGVCRACEPANIQRDATGRLLTFSEGAWQVFYDEYQVVGDLQLPRKMHFTGPDISGKLLLKAWQLDEGE
jgi:outer membrane lipoprotein LolB